MTLYQEVPEISAIVLCYYTLCNLKLLEELKWCHRKFWELISLRLTKPKLLDLLVVVSLERAKGVLILLDLAKVLDVMVMGQKWVSTVLKTINTKAYAVAESPSYARQIHLQLSVKLTLLKESLKWSLRVEVPEKVILFLSICRLYLSLKSWF